MQAMKAFLRRFPVCPWLCWLVLVWPCSGRAAGQDVPEPAGDARREHGGITAEAEEAEWSTCQGEAVGQWGWLRPGIANRPAVRAVGEGVSQLLHGRPACSDCSSPACAYSAEPCSYFDGPCHCQCGVDTRMYRSLLLARLWFEAEYVAWASSKTHLPPLLTSGAPPDTVLLFGDADWHGDLRSGGRLTGGYWFTPEHCFGVEGSYLDVDVGGTQHLASGADFPFPVLSRPIIDAGTGLPGSVTVSDPDQQLGAILIRSDVEFSGAEALLRRRLQGQQNYRFDGVVGYRYQRLYDGLHVDELFVSLDDSSGFDTDAVVGRSDSLESENEFHGGEIGLIGRWWTRCWALQVLGKAALGGTRTVTKIAGQTAVTVETVDGPVTDTAPGGVLALPSNIGSHAQSDFATVGELGIRVEYALTHQLYATFGYTLIYWSDVARLTDGIDLVVDPSQIPPAVNPAATRPGFAFRNSDFWAHGLNVGLHYEF